MNREEKIKKMLEISGYWVDTGDRIVKYKLIDGNTKCSKCNGTDLNCTVCHGKSVEKKPRWYQLIKRLKYWLKKK